MSLKIGDGNWAGKESKIMGYQEEFGKFYPQEIDFTRASTATKVNADGLIEEVASNIPRIEDGALLLEPQRTNIVTYSEDFSDASWTKANATVTPNDTVSPDGTTNASRVTTNAVDGYITTPFIATTGITYAVSLYVKSAGSNNNFRLRGYGASALPSQDFSATSEWQRFDYLMEGTTGGGIAYRIEQNSAKDPYDLYIWGAMVEQGSYATSYIPTSGAAATRLLETSSTSGLSSVIGQSEGVLYVDFEKGAEESTDGIGIALDTANRILFYINSNNLYAFLSSGGVGYINEIVYANIPLGQYKLAFRYKLNDCEVFINGVSVFAETTAIMPTSMDILMFNSTPSGSGHFHHNVNNVILFDTYLTDQELTDLTTL